MALTTRADFSNLREVVNGLITEQWDESFKRASAENVLMRDVFGAQEDPNMDVSYQLHEAFGQPRRIGEGEQFPSSTTTQGYKSTDQQYHYADSFNVSKQYRLDYQRRFEEIRRKPKNLAITASQTIEQSYADVLNNGWSTSYTDVYGQTVDNTTADSVAFFSASHSVKSGGSTFGNIIYSSGISGTGTVNPALSYDSIVAARAQGMVFQNSNGKRTPLRFSRILVSPHDRDYVNQILRSPGEVDTANNNQNYTLRDLQPIMSPYITKGYWFMLPSKEMCSDSLFSGFAQFPKLEGPDEDFKTKDRSRTLDYLYYIQLRDPALIFGSKGTNAA